MTKGRTDGRTDRRTGGKKCSWSCLVAAYDDDDNYNYENGNCKGNIYMFAKMYDTLATGVHQVMLIMMTSSNGNMFRVTGHLCGEFTGHQCRGALMFP